MRSDRVHDLRRGTRDGPALAWPAVALAQRLDADLPRPYAPTAKAVSRTWPGRFCDLFTCGRRQCFCRIGAPDLRRWTLLERSLWRQRLDRRRSVRHIGYSRLLAVSSL